MSDIASLVSRLIAPLARRVSLIVSRGVVTLVNDALKCQGLQVELVADELQDDVEHFQEYGFTHHPLAGAEVLFLSVGGVRSHGIVACVADRRYRPKNLGEGDVCLFTNLGERVYLDATGDLVNLGAKAGAEFVAQAQKTLDRLQAIVTGFNSHTHPTGVGPSGPPAVLLSTPVVAVAATKVKAT